MGRFYECVKNRERRFLSIIKRLIAGEELSLDDAHFLNKNEARLNRVQAGNADRAASST